jgi:alpha-L-fucosidase
MVRYVTATAPSFRLNLIASAFPGACPGVSERISDVSSLQIEDSPPLAAGSFNPDSPEARGMMRNRLAAIVLAWGLAAGVCSGQNPPAPSGPVPSENQMRWQEMEYYAFIHFSLNTYTDQSWGYGNEDVNLFNPRDLDCRQWARICREAGMKGIILTVKHHCGFCLWPSKYTGYSVRNAPWKNGRGDVVREMADACREYGLKLGIYLSPWDRNRADYGSPEYIAYFRNQLTELLTGYGPIFEVWFDGANGGSGYYGGANETRTIDPKTYYDWPNTYRLVRRLQPDIVIWNDGGDRADLRWVGTEEGFVGETNWSLLDAAGEVTWDMLHHGLENGDSWVPAEVNTSIRPEWFYHPAEDGKVKTVPRLMDTYYRSIGRNATLLLNFPVMPNGLIHPTDAKTAVEFGRVARESFAVNLAAHRKAEASNVRGNAGAFGADQALDGDPETFWATDDAVRAASLTIDLGGPTLFNRFLVRECIRLGQRVKAFTVEAKADGQWREVARATTIGAKRILRFPTVEAEQVRFTIADSRSGPVISEVGVYRAPVFLSAPALGRNQAGEISISTEDIGPVFHYTLDGSAPTAKSERYAGPFPADGKVEVRAIAVDPASGQAGPEGRERFDISRKSWTILGTDDRDAGAILDGDPLSVWHQRNRPMPVDLVVDLGAPYDLCGFKYLPDRNRWSSGTITNYRFYASADGQTWILADQGEFANIRNNPVWQIREFAPRKARYIKLQALTNSAGDDVAGYSEIDVITK